MLTIDDLEIRVPVNKCDCEECVSVNALIADWRMMREALNRVQGMKDVTCTDSCQADLFAQVCQDAIDGLKLKP